MQSVRKYLVGGNWKCNGTKDSISKLIATLNQMTINASKVDVVVAPISLHIPHVQASLKKDINVSVQNISPYKSGAYTGEVSVDQLKDNGIEWAIVGHSERRHIFHENDEMVAAKVKIALQNKIKVIACIGQKLEERQSSKTMEVIAKQMKAINEQIGSWSNVVVAYEPVWAIGTGKVATPEQAQQVHAYTREWLSKNSSAEASKTTRIIYGGSVNAKNSDNLIQKEDVDGFLVGGAALKPEFNDIVASCNK